MKLTPTSPASIPSIVLQISMFVGERCLVFEDCLLFEVRIGVATKPTNEGMFAGELMNLVLRQSPELE